MALLNNDATVAPGWLRAMVPVAQSDDRIGAVAAKMLFADRFHGIEFDVPDASHLVQGRAPSARRARHRGAPRRRACRRPAGVRRGLPRRGAAAAANRRGDRPLVERHRRAADRVGRLGRVDDLGSTVVPRTASRHAALRRRHRRPSPSARSPSGSTSPIPPEPFDVINNVGSNLFGGGFGGDRGFLEVDDGQYEEPADVFAWCGGAVLLEAGVPRRRRHVRRTVLPLLRGHRPVVARPAARLALRVRAGRRRAPPPRRRRPASARRCSGTAPNATAC